MEIFDVDYVPINRQMVDAITRLSTISVFFLLLKICKKMLFFFAVQTKIPQFFALRAKIRIYLILESSGTVLYLGVGGTHAPVAHLPPLTSSSE